MGTHEQKAETDGLTGHVLQPLPDAFEVGRLLGVSPKSVHKVVRQRKLGCVQVTGRDRRFTAEQIEQGLSPQRKTPGRVFQDPKIPAERHC